MEKIKTRISKQDKENLEQWKKWQDNYYSRENLEEKERLWQLIEDNYKELGLSEPSEFNAVSLMYFAFNRGLQIGRELEARKQDTNSLLERLFA